MTTATTSDAMTPAEVAAWLDRLGRKVEPEDLSRGGEGGRAWSFAADWAAAYEGDFPFMVDMAADARRGPLSPGKAKGVLNCYRAHLARHAHDGEPEVPEVERASEPGYYLHEGNVVLVVANRARTRVYAKRLVLPDPGDAGRARWVYDPGVIYRLAADAKLTLTEAAEFGHLNGYCARCGARLDDPASVFHGFGFTCYRKLGGTLTATRFRKEAEAAMAEEGA